MKVGCRGINAKSNTITLYILIASIVLNLSTLFIDNREVLSYIAGFLALTSNFMIFSILYGFIDVFYNNSLYVHLLPISKKKIFFIMIGKWLVMYCIYWVVYIGSILINVDTSILFKNIDIKGNIISLTLEIIAPIITVFTASSCIVIIKRYRKSIILLIIGFILVGKVSFYFDENRGYSYKDNIDIWELKGYRTIELLDDNKGITYDNSKQEYVDQSPTGEETIYYQPIWVFGSVTILLLSICLSTIEGINLEIEIKRMKRRALYESRWYDRWIQ